MLAMGGRAPEFTLPDQDEQSVSLSTLLRQGPLILYFYPADFTPGCTREACSIRDLTVEIQQAGLDVAGVSPQAPASPPPPPEKHKLQLTPLSPGGKYRFPMEHVPAPPALSRTAGRMLLSAARAASPLR